ncbi:hypothetical protein IWQ60_008429, partial [Tieghemiomyces parasiticus]
MLGLSSVHEAPQSPRWSPINLAAIIIALLSALAFGEELSGQFQTHDGNCLTLTRHPIRAVDVERCRPGFDTKQIFQVLKENRCDARSPQAVLNGNRYLKVHNTAGQGEADIRACGEYSGDGAFRFERVGELKFRIHHVATEAYLGYQGSNLVFLPSTQVAQSIWTLHPVGGSVCSNTAWNGYVKGVALILNLCNRPTCIYGPKENKPVAEVMRLLGLDYAAYVQAARVDGGPTLTAVDKNLLTQCEHSAKTYFAEFDRLGAKMYARINAYKREYTDLMNEAVDETLHMFINSKWDSKVWSNGISFREDLLYQLFAFTIALDPGLYVISTLIKDAVSTALYKVDEELDDETETLRNGLGPAINTVIG